MTTDRAAANVALSETQRRDPSAEAAPAPRHLVHVFPSFGYGGVPLRIVSMINQFGARYRHSIISLNGRTDSANRLSVGDSVRLEPFSSPGFGGLPRTLLAIRGTLARLKPDLLLTYNWGAADWALVNTLRHRCRHIHFESGFGPEEADGQRRLRVWYRRVALKRASRLVVPSHTLVRIATEIWRLPAEQVHLIPNGVDVALFSGTPGMVETAPNGDASGDIIIGTVAPLRAEKNLARLIRVFASLCATRPTRLMIVGEGVERPALEALSRELGVQDRVHFTGHIDEVQNAYRWFHIFAMSSDTEQMPNVLIQAMAAGRPVAATDVGDIQVILGEEGANLVVDKTDELAFAAALCRLVDDETLRLRLGRANQARVRERYALDQMAAAYQAMYDA